MKRHIYLIAFTLVLAFSTVATGQTGELLTLDDAIKIALEKNRGLIADTYDMKSAKWGTAASVSNYLPKVYYTSTWSRIDDETLEEADEFFEFQKQLDPSAERSTWKDMYSSNITVAQPIFNGGQEIAGIMAANTQRKERTYNQENSRLALIRDVKAAYFSAITARELLNVANEAHSLAQESLNVAKSRYEIGQINKSEVLRWEANLYEAEVTRIEAENAQQGAIISLSNLLGVKLTNKFTLAFLQEEQINSDLNSIDPEKISQFPDTGKIATHPSVKQMDQAVKFAKVERFSSIGTILPRANFTYSYQWETNDTMEPDGDENWTMGIQVEIPLFQSLGGVFGITQSEYSVRKAKSDKEDYSRGFLQQLHMAQLTISSAKKKVQAAKTGEQFATENLDLVKGRHKLGMASNLDLIDAQFTYTQSRSSVIQALGDFYQALASYEYLTSQSGK